MQLNKQELLPCPFCGGSPHECGRPGDKELCIYCMSCESQTEYFPDIESAIKKWNTRAQPKITVEQVKGMIEKMIGLRQGEVQRLIKNGRELETEECQNDIGLLEYLLKEINEAENEI